MFRDGDIVCFLGDSVTQSSRLQSYISAFYLTRFPKQRIRFVNCGLSGGTVDGAVRRLTWDVLQHRPTVVSVMFGMNDVNRGLYAGPVPSKTIVARREWALASYRGNVTNLSRSLANRSKAEIVFVTPPPYDETAKLPEANLVGVDGALKRCGGIVAQLARRCDAGLIDLHGKMSALNLQRQSIDPAFSLISQDRIHPGSIGQFVMAYLYLKAHRVPAVVSEIKIDVASRVMRIANGTLANFEKADSGVSFECLENALPLPMDEPIEAAMAHWPIVADLSREVLAVNFSDESRYSLKIDGELIANYPAAELRAGIDLAFNPRTPQQRQARRLLAAIERCRQQELRLRRFVQVQVMLTDAKVPVDDDDAAARFCTRHLARAKPSEAEYFSTLFEDYRSTKLKREALEAELTSATEALWQLNTPVPHRYELVRQSGMS